MATQNVKFAGEAAINALASEINKKLTKVSSMPESPTLNMIVLYVGTTTGAYTQGNIYQWDGTQWNQLNQGGAITADCYKLSDIAETEISDGDYFPFYDTSATTKKKTLWSNIKEKLRINKKYDIDDELSADLPTYIPNSKQNFESMTWSGNFQNIRGNNIWTDGTNIYYSYGTGEHYKLNGIIWEPMTWSGYTNFLGQYVWTDGNNIYFSDGTNLQYKLNGTTWESMTWSGYTDFDGSMIWTDGTNIYYSYNSKQYKLNGTTWESMTWSGFTPAYGNYVWTDGTNIYYSGGTNAQYKLNGTTWESVIWNGFTDFGGRSVWTDGINIYCSSYPTTYVLNNNTWEVIINDNSLRFGGRNVWTDGTNIYASEGSLGQYKLVTKSKKLTWSSLISLILSEISSYFGKIPVNPSTTPTEEGSIWITTT